MKMIDSAQAAKILKVSDRRVRALVASGDLKATKVGRTLVFDLETVQAFAKTRNKKAGRPPGQD